MAELSEQIVVIQRELPLHFLHDGVEVSIFSADLAGKSIRMTLDACQGGKKLDLRTANPFFFVNPPLSSAESDEDIISITKAIVGQAVKRKADEAT